jgi:hypothetical protein
MNELNVNLQQLRHSRRTMKTMRLISILLFAASLPVVCQTVPDLAGLVDAQLPGLHSAFFAPVASPTIRTGVLAMSAAVLDLMKK